MPKQTSSSGIQTYQQGFRITLHLFSRLINSFPEAEMFNIRDKYLCFYLKNIKTFFILDFFL